MKNGDLLRYIHSFQSGRRYADWEDGDLASELGHLRMLRGKSDLRFTAKAMNLAAAKGHLDVIQWLHENRTEGCTRRAMEDAAYHGHVEVVQYLREHYPNL